MKKIVFVLSTVLAFSFIIMACASEKKSKKGPSGITIEVVPSVIGEITASSNTRTLTAIVKSNGIIQPNTSVSWVVNPSTFGVCTPNQSVSTLFTADTSKTGQGSIVASYNGTNSAPVQFSLNEATAIIDSIEITPSSVQSISSTQTVTFTATAKAGTTPVSNVSINWTVTGSGSISPNPSNGGSPVIFTPSGNGNATVKASYGAVNSSIVNVVVGSTVPATQIKVLVQNGAFAAGSDLSDMWWWRNSGQTYLGIDVISGSGYDGQTRNLYKFDFKDIASNWDGLQFSGSDTDYSEYNTLVFYAKGVSAADTKFVARFVNTSSAADEGVFNISNQTWTKCEIPLTIARTSIATPFVAVFVQSPSGGDNPTIAITPPSQVMIDYVYLKK